MGSDMYMEAQNFQPRLLKIQWIKGLLVIQKDFPFSGYTTVFEGDIDEGDTTQMALLAAIGVSKIPPRPVPAKPTWTEMVEIVYNYYGYGDHSVYKEIYDFIVKTVEEGIVPLEP